MRLLGAILCGGRSSRFGSDKALALLDGVPLWQHVARALTPQVAAIVACGRDLPGIAGVADVPAPGLGPLGGLCGALRAAEAEGFDAVLSVPCDAPALPQDLAARLGPHAPAYVAALPVIGLWPAALAGALEHFLAHDPKRSVRGWAAAAGATAAAWDRPIANVNTADDLRALRG